MTYINKMGGVKVKTIYTEMLNDSGIGVRGENYGYLLNIFRLKKIEKLILYLG